MYGLSVDSPYPATEDLTADWESVRILSPAYADHGSELTAILQYVWGCGKNNMRACFWKLQ